MHCDYGRFIYEACNTLQLEAARATPVLFRVNCAPCQVWSHWTYRLPYYSVFAADTLLYAVTLTSDLWPWTFALWCDKTLYQIWTHSSNPLQSYSDFSVWPYDHEQCIMCCARLWDNFHKVWPSTTYPCLNYSGFLCWYVMSRCDLDLWPVDLESSCMIHQASRDQSLYEIWAKSRNPRLNYR